MSVSHFNLPTALFFIYEYSRDEIVRYLLISGVTFLIVGVFLRERLAHRKIQPLVPPRRQMIREFAYSIRTILIYSIFVVITYYAYEHNVRLIYWKIDERGWTYLAGSFVLVVLVHDAYFYWTHRLMHHPKLFPIIHYAHHWSKSPTPWAAYSFDPGEAFVHGAFLTLFTLAVPLYVGVELMFIIHMLVRNVLGHCGHELLPAGAISSRWYNWNLTTTHHEMHHRYAKYNYGLSFSWWDKLMGTEHPKYVETFLEVASRQGRPAVSSCSPTNSEKVREGIA